MAKRQRPGVLNRLAGKRFFFSGKFDYGVKESLMVMADVQHATIQDDLDDKIDYLVVSDLNGSKTIQKKAMSLNGKGAAIQVIDADGCKKLAEPTAAEILALLRAGESEACSKLCRPTLHFLHTQTAKYSYHSEDLRRTKLQNVDVTEVKFDDCDFTGAELEHVHVGTANRCNFSKVSGRETHFADLQGGIFYKGNFRECEFNGDLSEADFTGSVLEAATFADRDYFQRRKSHVHSSVIFNQAKLKLAEFFNLHLKSPSFDGADLTSVRFQECIIESGNFRNAKLRNAVLVGSSLTGADLTNADLTGANLADADLNGANLTGANLKNANLRGAKLQGVDLSKAGNYDPDGAKSGTIGPVLTELDSVNAKAKRIHVKFRLQASEGDDEEEFGIDSAGLRYGWGIRAPMHVVSRRSFGRGQARSFSDALLQLANATSNLKVRFETVDVSSTKSPKGGKELRDLVMRGIAEAFAQELPPAAELAAATKKYREAGREKGAAERERREKAKAEAAKQREKAKKQIARKIKKTVGEVSDVASFLKALEVRIEKPKIDKATKMLKASGFKLFNDVTDQDVSGVVKSQTDPDLVYACRLAHDGQYSCCTQNLNVCGGLRGSICKHLLVLIIGLVQAGELDPTTIDGWIAKTHSTKPELDKEVMGAIFIKYKGAEAGEVDWRPTETVPEDYYAL